MTGERRHNDLEAVIRNGREGVQVSSWPSRRELGPRTLPRMAIGIQSGIQKPSSRWIGVWNRGLIPGRRFDGSLLSRSDLTQVH